AKRKREAVTVRQSHGAGRGGVTVVEMLVLRLVPRRLARQGEQRHGKCEGKYRAQHTNSSWRSPRHTTKQTTAQIGIARRKTKRTVGASSTAVPAVQPLGHVADRLGVRLRVVMALPAADHPDRAPAVRGPDLPIDSAVTRNAAQRVEHALRLVGAGPRGDGP